MTWKRGSRPWLRKRLPELAGKAAANIEEFNTMAAPQRATSKKYPHPAPAHHS